MEKYDYYESVENSVREYIDQNYGEGLNKSFSSADEATDDLYDRMFNSDSVTGNASGSFTFSAWVAEENICHNLDLLYEAMKEFCETDINIAEKGAEWCDVTIRCYLLNGIVRKVVDEIWEDPEDEDTEEEEIEDHIAEEVVTTGKSREELEKEYDVADHEYMIRKGK